MSKKKRFHTYIEDYTIADYTDMLTPNGVTYQMTVLYKTDPVAYLYYAGCGGSTHITFKDAETYKKHAPRIMSIADRISKCIEQIYADRSKDTQLFWNFGTKFADSTCLPQDAVEVFAELIMEIDEFYAEMLSRYPNCYAVVVSGNEESILKPFAVLNDNSDTHSIVFETTVADLCTEQSVDFWHNVTKLLRTNTMSQNSTPCIPAYCLPIAPHKRTYHLCVHDIESAVIAAYNLRKALGYNART